MPKKYISPQFEFAPMASEFNLTGEVAIQFAPPKVSRDLLATPELPMTAESQLRNILSAKGVAPEIQARVIADATAKAAPGYMDKFFPPGCDNFRPIRRESGDYSRHCANCGIIDTAHKNL